MCVYNHVATQEQTIEAGIFLSEYGAAQQHMAKAAASLLKLTACPTDPEQRRQYDRMHKRMKRLMREWNLIEHQRELK